MAHFGTIKTTKRRGPRVEMLDDILLTVYWFETLDGFVCECCIEDGFRWWHVHATEGGNILPVPFDVTRIQLKRLKKEVCLVCDLPVTRSKD